MSQDRLSRHLASVKEQRLYVGGDLALEHHVVVVLDEQARQVDRFGFDNSAAGYAYFAQRIQQVQARCQAAEVLVGMEPTNYYWKQWAAHLEAQGISYRLVNPYTVQRHREGDQLDRAKDDRRDALVIADLLRTGKATQTQRQVGAYAELREYAVHRARLRKDRARQKTLVTNLAGQLFPELTQVFKDLGGQTARALLRQGAAAVQIRELSEAEFLARVRAGFAGRRLMVSKLRRVYALAQRSVGVTEGTQGLQTALRQHLTSLELLQAQLATVEAEMAGVLLELPEAQYLLSVPGLGIVSAATILGEIGDPRRYQRANQLIKLAGTQPVPRTSGRHQRSRSPISHQGRPRLRTTLYFAVLRLVQCDPGFARRYQELLTRPHNPLQKQQALTALINKLLRILWALLHQHTCYQLDYQGQVA